MRVERKKQRVGTKAAETFLTYNVFEGQRNLRPKRLAELIDKMNDGRFLTGRFAVAYPPNGGTPVLLNGQHQAHAIVNTGSTVDSFVEEFYLSKDDPADVLAQLFAQYDEGGMRSVADIAKPYALAYGMGDFPARAINNVTGALAWAEWGEAMYKRSKDQRAKLLGSNERDARFLVDTCWGEGDPRFMQRVPVLTVMLYTVRKSRQDAVEFWSQVRDGELLKKTDPAFRLREFLLDVAVSRRADGIRTRGTRRKGINKAVGWREVMAKCIYAWNAYRKGEELRILRFYESAGMPKVQ